jgi:WD domain, G-beta repeat
VPQVYGASLLFAPDERFLGQFGGPTLHLYDTLAEESKDLRVADGFREAIRCAAFSADSRLAAVAVDADIALGRAALPAVKSPAATRLFCLELTTQQIRYSFPEFKARVEALALSPDGRHLAVAAEPDHAVHLLEMKTGAEVCRFAGHGGRVQRLVFSSQGNRLASASADTTALVWDVSFLAQGKKAVAKLADVELQAQWQAMTLPGGPEVHEAIGRLSQHPDEVVPYFKPRFKTLKEVDLRELARKIKELDDDDFFVRENASLFLTEWIDVAHPLLRDVVAKSKSPEAIYRARLILADHKPHPEYVWREFRAIEVLERMAVPAARTLLRSLADEAPRSLRAREAQAALNRLRN